jgi:hypothetical protein
MRLPVPDLSSEKICGSVAMEFLAVDGVAGRRLEQNDGKYGQK